MMRFIYSFIIIAHCTASLWGMDYGTCEGTHETGITNNNERVRVAELVKNSRRFTPITKEINGLISAIYPLDKHTLGIIESDSPEAIFSTLHVFNTQKNVWNARRIKANERRLAEFGFNIESADMDSAHQKKLITLLKEFRVWKSMVQPVSIQGENKVFVDTDNTIVIIDPKEPKKNISFPLPATISPYKEICPFSTLHDHVIVATNTTWNGAVQVFSYYGAQMFYESVDDTAEKPQKVCMDTHNTIVVGRTNDIRIYRYGPFTTEGHIFRSAPLHIFKGSLVDWYDNKAFVFHDNHLKIVYDGNTPDQVLDHEGVKTPWVLSVGNGFFYTKTRGIGDNVSCTVLSPYFHCIQRIHKAYKRYNPHRYGEHSRMCNCHVIDDTMPVLHGAITETALSHTGRTMFAVDKGKIMVLNPKPLIFEDNPETIEEFRFLAQGDIDQFGMYCDRANRLFEDIRKRLSCSLSAYELHYFSSIPERLRQDLAHTVTIDSPFMMHTMAPYSSDEQSFLTFNDNEGACLINKLTRITTHVSLKDLELYCRMPERFRKKVEETIVVSSPFNIHTMVPLTDKEQKFLKKNYNCDNAYAPQCVFKNIIGTAHHYDFSHMRNGAYVEIPERFRNAIENTYNECKEQFPRSGSCVIS